MAINVKRMDKKRVRVTEFRHIDVGSFFEDHDEEMLYFKIGLEEAIEIGSYVSTTFDDECLVNEVDAEINYVRKYDDYE